VGIGEASYANVAPTLIADMYPVDDRTRILSFYFVAVPVGSALGFILGGQASLYLGWRWAFRITPGVSFFLATLLCIFMKEPPRGMSDGRLQMGDYSRVENDGRDLEEQEANVIKPPSNPSGLGEPPGRSSSANVAASKSWWEDVKEVWGVYSFMWSTFGLTAVTFVTGALAQWGPSYLHRVNCADFYGPELAACKSEINLIFGIMSCITGIGGTFLGSSLSRWYSTETNAADGFLCGLGLLTAAPFIFLGVYMAPLNVSAAWMMIFAAELLIGIIWVPVTAMLLYVIHPLQRATASGMQTMFSHFFGDATSPVLVGYIADLLQDDGETRSYSLQLALYPSALFALLGSFCFFLSTRFLAEDRRAQNSATVINKVTLPLSNPVSPIVSLSRRNTTSANAGAASVEPVSLSNSIVDGVSIGRITHSIDNDNTDNEVLQPNTVYDQIRRRP